MSISKQLFAFVFFSVLVLIGSLSFSISVGFSQQQKLQYIGQTIIPSVRTLGTISVQVGEFRRLITSFYRVAGTPEETSLHVVPDMQATAEKIDTAFRTYAALSKDPQDKQMIDNEWSVWKRFVDAANKAIPLAEHNQKDLLEVQKNVMRSAGSDYLKAMKEHVAYNIRLQQQAQADAEASLRSGLIGQMVLAVVATLLLIVLGWMIQHKSVRALNSMRDLMQVVDRERNLALRGEELGPREIRETIGAFNRLLTGLCNDFEGLQTSCRQVFTASEQVSSASKFAAGEASRQSQSASSMAAATEEMTVSINHVASRAADTRQVSADSGSQAKQGVTVIETTAAGIDTIAVQADSTAAHMKELQQRAAHVDTVVGVIRDLAEQTNLLALNAAIEAARAGENGRGFAVVADEVRKLAERTANATSEIDQIVAAIRDGAEVAAAQILSTVESVRVGVAQTRNACEMMTGIHRQSSVAVSMVEEISAALAQQSSAASSIAEQVEQVARMAESSDLISSQTRDSADALHRMAQQMLAIVNKYSL
jgi:methyl-accepting chemotaxis protein